VLTLNAEKRLEELGLELPATPEPLATFVTAVTIDGYVYVSGHGPFFNGELKYQGKVGQGVNEQQAYEAAKLCALNCLSTIKDQIGSLDNIDRVVKVQGFVNSAPDFTQQPKVINGASDLLVKLFGERGQHARTAVGVNVLPFNITCEVEMIVKVK
jgi:Putative translation initiation inhibitor, yjgF family